MLFPLLTTFLALLAVVQAAPVPAQAAKRFELVKGEVIPGVGFRPTLTVELDSQPTGVRFPFLAFPTLPLEINGMLTSCTVSRSFCFIDPRGRGRRLLLLPPLVAQPCQPPSSFASQARGPDRQLSLRQAAHAVLARPAVYGRG